jgi:hypothetical protein
MRLSQPSPPPCAPTRRPPVVFRTPYSDFPYPVFRSSVSYSVVSILFQLSPLLPYSDYRTPKCGHCPTEVDSLLSPTCRTPAYAHSRLQSCGRSSTKLNSLLSRFVTWQVCDGAAAGTPMLDAGLPAVRKPRGALPGAFRIEEERRVQMVSARHRTHSMASAERKRFFPQPFRAHSTAQHIAAQHSTAQPICKQRRCEGSVGRLQRPRRDAVTVAEHRLSEHIGADRTACCVATRCAVCCNRLSTSSR